MAAYWSAGRASIPASTARTPAAERAQPNRRSPVPHRASSPYPASPQTEALWTGPTEVLALLTGSPRPGLPTAAGLASAPQETTDPGTNGPGASGPGANGPGANGPGANGPGPVDSGTTDLPAAHRGTTDPGRNGPGTTGPATTALAAAHPGATGPGTTGLGTAGPAAAHPGMTGAGTAGLRASGPATARLAEALPGMADLGMTGPERTVREPAFGVLVRTRRLQLGLLAAASLGPRWRAWATSARTAMTRTALSQTGPLRAAAPGLGHRSQARCRLEVGQRLPRMAPHQTAATTVS